MSTLTRMTFCPTLTTSTGTSQTNPGRSIPCPHPNIQDLRAKQIWISLFQHYQQETTLASTRPPQLVHQEEVTASTSSLSQQIKSKTKSTILLQASSKSKTIVLSICYSNQQQKEIYLKHHKRVVILTSATSNSLHKVSKDATLHPKKINFLTITISS